MKKILLLLLLIPFPVLAQEKAVVDINELSITEIQDYVDKGYLTYEKIAKLYLERINEYNKQYNAIITINENVIEEAKILDIEYKEKGRRSLIYGLPVIVKDNIDVKGMPTTNGTKALLDSYPNKNASVVQKLIDNGALIIAKSNMDEFAFNATYSHSSFGYVYNAYNTKYSSYGSSGGSAVSVASNLAVYALGTDTGCSVRLPSSANGVVGMRPSISIMNNDGIILFEQTRDVVGIITKYVSDNAIVLNIIDNVEEDYLSEKSLDGITIGVAKSYMNNSLNKSRAYGKTDKEIYDLMQEAIENLKSLGANIVYINALGLNYQFNATTMCYNFNNYIKNTNSKIKSFNDLIKNGGYTQYISDYAGYYCNHDYTKTSEFKNYLENRNNNINRANLVFTNNNLDAIIYPTIKELLYEIENIYNKGIPTASSDTAPLIGFPAMSIPIGYYNNLPYGMEILAQDKNEEIIYRIALAYENATSNYKTPTIAPSLYEIEDKIEKLLEYYDKYYLMDEYLALNNETKIYFSNYDGSETKIDELILKYQNFKVNNNNSNLETSNKSKYFSIYYAIIIIVLIVIITLRKLITKKHKE